MHTIMLCSYNRNAMQIPEATLFLMCEAMVKCIEMRSNTPKQLNSAFPMQKTTD